MDESRRCRRPDDETRHIVVNQAALAVLRIERDTRTGEAARRAVKFARQFHGFIGRAGINGQKFSNL